MTHDAMHAAALILSGATVITFAAAPQVPLTDLQILVLSASCGAIGGIVATLMSDQVITVRGMAMRGLASVLVAPSIVSGVLIHYGTEPRLMLVASAAGLAGMIAWPVASALPRIVPARLKDVIDRIITAIFGGPPK